MRALWTVRRRSRAGRASGCIPRRGLALEGQFQARQHVLAGGVVGTDQKDALDALLVHVEAHRLRRLVVLPGGREHIGRAQFAGELRGAGIGDHRHGLRVDQRLERGQHHVRPDVADDEIDLVGFDQLLGLLHPDVGLLRVVLVDDLDRQAADLAAEMVETELEGVAHIVADHGGRAAERADEADLDGLLLGRCVLNHGRPRRQRQRGRGGHRCYPHRVDPSRWRTFPVHGHFPDGVGVFANGSDLTATGRANQAAVCSSRVLQCGRDRHFYLGVSQNMVANADQRCPDLMTNRLDADPYMAHDH